eukprot:scaffold641217_cov59-Attheya_sp.AAC.3
MRRHRHGRHNHGDKGVRMCTIPWQACLRGMPHWTVPPLPCATSFGGNSVGVPRQRPPQPYCHNGPFPVRSGSERYCPCHPNCARAPQERAPRQLFLPNDFDFTKQNPPCIARLTMTLPQSE